MAPAANACPQCGAPIDSDAGRGAKCQRCGQPTGASKTSPPRGQSHDAPPIEAPPLAAPPAAQKSGQTLDGLPELNDIESSPSFLDFRPTGGATGTSQRDAQHADFESIQIQAAAPTKRREEKQRPLRRLSHEERAVRRARMNVIMLALGFTVLVITLAVLLYLTGG